MTAFAAVFPILPGKLDAWKQFTQELTGPRRSAWQAAHRRLGIRTEQSFLQHTPQGDVAMLYLEADDPMRVNQAIADSGDPFDRWFRERVLELHGVDLAGPPPGPPPQLCADLNGQA